MDELMRHQPTLKSDAMAGVVRLLQQLCEMGRDPQCTVDTQNEASRPDNIEQATRGHGEGQGTLGATTDDEDDDDITRDAVSQRASPQPEAEWDGFLNYVDESENEGCLGNMSRLRRKQFLFWIMHTMWSVIWAVNG